MKQPIYTPQSTGDTSSTHELSDDAFANFTRERIIPAEIARSWLLANAMKPELFDK